MAYETTQAKVRAVARAGNALGLARTIYVHMAELSAMLATYQSGTDPALTAALNAVYSAGERAELATVIGQLRALKSDWEANHADLIRM